MCRSVTLRRLAALLSVSLPAVAAAHDPGLSSARVELVPGCVRVSVAFAASDVLAAVPVDHDGDGALAPGELVAGRRALLAWLGARLEIDGRRAEPRAADVAVAANGDLAFRLELTRPPGRALRWRVAGLARLARGHRQLAQLVDAAGRVVAEALLSPRRPELCAHVDRGVPARSAWTELVVFVGLGVEHVLTGYDHVLFLLGLLLATRGLGGTVRVITAFTVAHSLSLAAAVLGLVRLPAAVVEPGIALSIVYVGVENLLGRGEGRRRWLCAFGFGLVHGLGFASVLTGLDIGHGLGLVLPLLGFNAGVEVGQLAVALVALPLIAVLRRRPSYTRRILPAASLLVSAAGALWLLQRLS